MSTRNSLKVGLTAIFAALHAILYLLSFGLWRNWAIYIEPFEGIFLGPWMGFSAALMGSVIARIIRPIDFWMFGVVAEPLGVLVCGFLARGKWKPAILIYGFMLLAYFVHPFGRALPLWTILDILISFVLIYPVAKMGNYIFMDDVKRSSLSFIFVSFIGTVTDSLTRVFLFIPVGLYSLFGLSFDELQWIFVTGAASSYIEDALVVLVSVLVGIPLLAALKKLKFPC